MLKKIWNYFFRNKTQNTTEQCSTDIDTTEVQKSYTKRINAIDAIVNKIDIRPKEVLQELVDTRLEEIQTKKKTTKAPTKAKPSAKN